MFRPIVSVLVCSVFTRSADETRAFSLFRAEEVKEHPYFKDVDWKQVYLLKLTPPLIPPRGEVNAADAFDIGNFDEDDTKGIKVRERHVHLPRTSVRCICACDTLSLLVDRS
jgi:hypothetical protein